jgi:hypothetical protein
MSAIVDRPAADYVGHPAMDAGSYRVTFSCLLVRPGVEGLWCKRFETWTESGRYCGAWRWVRAEDRGPEGDER